jgi:hypothetical protein
MTAMTAVTSMHEEVHERTREDRQPNEEAPDVCAMLREKKGSGDEDEAEQHEPDARRQEAPARFILLT